MRLMLRTPDDVALDLRDRLRKRRLGMNLSQAGLAERAGVNLHSLRRFEKSGAISFDALLKLALALDVLDDFDRVGAADNKSLQSQTLDEVLANSRPVERSRGRRK